MANKKQILIIDDIKSIVEEVEQVLLMEGFQVLTAINGYEAAQKLENEPIDLVVTDLMMKELNGFEIISYLKTFNKNMPIIVLSGQSEAEYIKKALQLEADIFLKKPCSSDDLVQAVKSLLN